jgi:hypothetical protein
MTRWEALVRYDDEIRAAAEKLFPFGEVWVDKLGDAFFALNEDRKYLANIVEQLTKEAEHSAVVDWLSKFSQTADGEKTSEEAMAVLVDAQAKGYVLDVKTSGAITATKDSSISHHLTFGRMPTYCALGKYCPLDPEARMRRDLQTKPRKGSRFLNPF